MRGLFRHPPFPQQPLPQPFFIPPPGGARTVGAGGIASRLAFGVPSLSGGAILPTGIPSRLAVGTPFINQQEKILPSGIASGLVIGVPRVAHSATIAPGGIASALAIGVPTLVGTHRYISMLGIPSGLQIGTPKIVGGTGALYLFIGGIERTSLLNITGAGTNLAATTLQSNAIGRATLTFDIATFDQTFKPTAGQTVRLLENGLTLFAGCIDTVVKDWEAGTTQMVVYHITALDKSTICSRRVATAPVYDVGSDVVGVIQNVVQNFLNGEGITTNLLPPAGDLGTLTAPLTPGYIAVSDLFNQIATISGTVWWIDVNGALNFSTEANLPVAPFALTATSGDFRKVSASVSLSGAGATQGYRNKQYVVTNLNVLPGSGTGGSGGSGGPTGVTENYVWHPGNPGYIVYPNGSTQLQVSLPIQSVISMTINGHVQTVMNFNDISGPLSSGPFDNGWFYVPGYPQLSWTFGPPVDMGAIIIEYIPGNPQSNQASVQAGTALSPTDPFGSTFGNCGSGVFEAIQQVNNISSQADLNALATAILNRSGGVPTIVQFETDKAGLQVGQILSVNIPILDLTVAMAPVYLLITQVNAVAENSPLQYGSRFHWSVIATSNLDPGNWINYYQNLLLRSAHPLPVLQYENTQVILAPSGSLAAGTVVTNPIYFARTGALVEIFGGFGVPPVDQDLEITVNDLSLGLFLGKITIPAGSFAQITYTPPAGSTIYTFDKDTVQVIVKYIVKGPNPIPASNGTLWIRRAM